MPRNSGCHSPLREGKMVSPLLAHMLPEQTLLNEEMHTISNYLFLFVSGIYAEESCRREILH